MNKTPWLVSSALALSCISLSAFASEGPRPGVIYGDDDRLDLYSVSNTRDLALADATVALVNSDILTPKGADFDIKADPFGRAFGLCAKERFFDQPTGGFCSGSLVAEDIIITAGHCITSTSECKTTKFLFNYAVKQEGVYPTSAKADDVVGCKEIIARKQEGAGADFAVIRLDRKITNHKPLAINRVSDLKPGDKVGVIGHPSGLPTKVAFGDSEVRDVTAPGFFVANLDTYGGNSGSAVFNTTTGLIEGILVRGENDFVYENGCRVSNVCPATGCRGEDVTKISVLANLIPGETREEPTPPTPTPPTPPTPREPPSSRWPSAHL